MAEANRCSVELPGDDPSEEQIERFKNELERLQNSIPNRSGFGVAAALNDWVRPTQFSQAHPLKLIEPGTSTELAAGWRGTAT